MTEIDPNPYQPPPAKPSPPSDPKMSERKRSPPEPGSPHQILIKFLITGIIVVPLLGLAIALILGLPFLWGLF